MKSIKISDYFELIHPKYTYLQIIPHKSIRNYNSSNIVKAISDTYKSISKRIHKENKKIFFETNFKMAYILDITKDNCSFYFLVPQYYKSIILDKINEIWNKATINEVSSLNSISNNSLNYSVFYKKDDCLSLYVDKKSNNPLNQIINVADIMQDDDKIRIVYNFLPTNQLFWQDKFAQLIRKIDDNKPLEKNIFSFDYILKTTLNIIVEVLDVAVEIIGDFVGSPEDKNNKSFMYNQLYNLLNINNKKILSNNTKHKKDATVINTQILLQSYSKDSHRRYNNITSTYNAYNTISEDNELIFKKIRNKNIPQLENYDFKIQKSLFSTDECNNFIQIPARELLQSHKISYIKTEETIIPTELQQGTKLLGNSTYKSKITPVYLENDYNNGNLPLTIIGSQGAGKTTYIKHYSHDCIKANECLIILDIIKDCDVSNKIEAITPKDKLVVVDLSKESDLQGFGFNEITINDSFSNYKKCELASLQSQEVMSFIDSISTGEPLSPKMRRYLNSASNVVFSLGYSSIKDVVRCLEDCFFREKCINNLNIELKELLSDEVSTLQQLNEYTKATKDSENKELCGTKDSKIEFILDRISILRENFKFKYMYNKSLDNNINLVDCMNKGKVVLIKMRESDFPTKMQKNIMVTYWISKIWLSCQLRGSIQSQPLRTNVIIDEVFQAPTSMTILDYILPQSRKFGLKFIFSSQYTKQLDKLFNSLEASGSSFMLLTGSTESDFNYFKEKLTNFEYEDLRDMSQFSSMCLIKYSKGYSNFIVKLPYDSKLD